MNLLVFASEEEYVSVLKKPSMPVELETEGPITTIVASVLQGEKCGCSGAMVPILSAVTVKTWRGSLTTFLSSSES